jgi:RHS repeat-associated protein
MAFLAAVAATSAPITIPLAHASPCNPNHFIVAFDERQPGQIDSGARTFFKASAANSSNTVCTSYTGTVTFSITPESAGGNSSWTHNPVAAVSGVARVDFVITGLPSVTITATAGTLTGSASFPVGQTYMTLSLSGSPQAGVPTTVTISAMSAWTNQPSEYFDGYPSLHTGDPNADWYETFPTLDPDLPRWSSADVDGNLISGMGNQSPNYGFISFKTDFFLQGVRNLWAYDFYGAATPSTTINITVQPGLLAPVPPPPGTGNNPPYTNQQTGGDPVNTFEGSYGATFEDTAIPGRGPAISFGRSYNSNDTRVLTLGPGWTHSYSTHLDSPNDGTYDIILVGPQGRSDRYAKSGAKFVAPVGVHRTLVHNPDGTYVAQDTSLAQWFFDSAGKLMKIQDRYGNASTLTYAGGLLTGISDPAGRGSLSLQYTGGQLTSVTDWASPPRSVTYQYDGNSRLWKVTDREGKTTTYGYDGTSQRLAGITDARGHTALALTYDGSGRVLTQKDARGVATGDQTSFDYVVNGDGSRSTTVTYPVTSFEPTFHPTLVDAYASTGFLTQRTSGPSSSETLTEQYTYDLAGNRTSVTDPRGNRTDYCYDINYAGAWIAPGDGNLTRRIDPAPTSGANRPTTLFKYDTHFNMLETVAPKGVSSGTVVDCWTNLSTINTSYATTNTYDSTAAKLLSVTNRFTDPDSGAKTAITKYEYGDAANPGLVTRIIPPRGNTTGTPDYTYATTMMYFGSGSKAGMLSSITDALGGKITYDHDSVGRMIASVDPIGNAAGEVPADHTTNYVDDKEDRVRFVKLPAPAAGGSQLVSETRYDEVGNPIVRIATNGQVTLSSYDERDALFQLKESPSTWTDPAVVPGDVIVSEYGYDAAGNTTRVTRAKGDAANERVTDTSVDGNGRVRAETEYPSWPATTPALTRTTSYDANGNILTTVDPLNRTTANGYDALNRLMSVTYSDGVTPNVSYAYDANGNRTTMSDGTGTTTYVLDELNRLDSVSAPGPKTVGYRYDLDSNRTKTIYPDATAVTYTFNKADQMSSLQDWAGRTVTYSLRADGLASAVTNPDTTSTAYVYDNTRRLIDIAGKNSAGQYVDRSFYTLDSIGNVTGVNHGLLSAQFGRPDGMTGSNGSWTGTYPSINEVTPNDSTVLASPSGPNTPAFYEVSLSNVQVPMDLTSIKFRVRLAKSGDNGGQTVNLTVELGQGTTVIVSSSYSALAGVTGSGWLDSTVTLTAQQAASITDFNDLRFRFVPSSSGGGQARKAQVSFAELSLSSQPNPAAQTTYSYDRLGRLTSSSGPEGSPSYGYDPVGNRLSSGASTYVYDRADRITSAGASSVTVDTAGNMTVRGADTFAYDQAARLKTATVLATTETYAYDGDALRFSRQVGAGTPTRYVSDVNLGLPVILDDGTRKYVYGRGLAYAISGSTIEVYHLDRVGTVRAITTASGSVAATYRNDDWGNVTGQTGSSTQPFGFSGEPHDGTNLTYLRARYYDPTIGRFMSRDSVNLRAPSIVGLNRYSYANGNPVRLRDPSGRWTVGICSDIQFRIFGRAVLAYQGCVVASSNLQFGLTASYGGGGGNLAPVSGSIGLVAQFSNADYIEDLAGPFDNVGGSVGADLGVQGSGFLGSGRCGQSVGGITFGPTATTPQAGWYGVRTITEYRTLLGGAAPSCKPKALQ